MTIRADEEDHDSDNSNPSTIESQDYDNDVDYHPRGPRFHHAGFAVDDPYLMAAIRDCGLWPNAPHRPLVFSSDWTTEYRRDSSTGRGQWILRRPKFDHALSPSAQVLRRGRCGMCDASDNTCIGGLPCTQCSQVELNCDTCEVTNEDYDRSYDGPSTLRYFHRVGWLPNEENDESFAALVQQAQGTPVVPSIQQRGGSREIQSAASQAGPSTRASRRRALPPSAPRRHGRLQESPPISTKMLQNYHEVTFPELITYDTHL